jgi:hypothetical protein
LRSAGRHEILTLSVMKRILSLGCLCSALALSAVVHAQDVAITDDAREHFSAGVSFMQDPDGARYEEAYREFRRAYEISPSWKILGNLGIAALRLERDGEAIEAFRKYLSEGGTNVDGAERSQFERDLATLESSVVRVKLTVSPPGAQLIDTRMPPTGSPITTRYTSTSGTLDIGVRAGHHKIVARLDGYEDAVWEVDLDPRQQVAHVFELKQPTQAVAVPPPVVGGSTPMQADEPSRPVPTSVYVGLAATGVLAIGGGVVAVMAKGKHSDFEKLNENLRSDADLRDAEDLRDSGKTLNLVADALFGGAIVAGGVTAVLYFTRPKASQTSFRVEPLVAKNGGGVFVSGAF